MPANAITRVALCDDAAGFPELVTAWLDRAEETELVVRTGSASELLEVLEATRPDVVLLDFMLPEGPTDPERVQRIRELAPGVRIVLVSSLPAIPLGDEAARVGADAFCTKATTAERLLAAIAGD